jgi:hypothetical protein
MKEKFLSTLIREVEKKKVVLKNPIGDTKGFNIEHKRKGRGRLGARAPRRSDRHSLGLGDVSRQVAAVRLQKKTVSFRKLPQIRTGKSKPAFFKGII